MHVCLHTYFIMKLIGDTVAFVFLSCQLENDAIIFQALLGEISVMTLNLRHLCFRAMQRDQAELWWWGQYR